MTRNGELVPVVTNTKLSELTNLGHTLFERLVEAIRSTSSEQLFGDVEDAVYVKSADGQIVLCNPAYDKIFGGDLKAVGRNASAFLDQSVFVLSKASDDLILSGADRLEFSHTGRNSAGDSLSMVTFKKSLLGMGHPRMAVLGVTRVEEVVPANQAAKIQSLNDAWKQFQTLDLRDRELAKGIVAGMKIRELAEQLDVSEKTVENRRNAIFRTLSIDGATDLVKIMVRLQDNGFCDFGL